MSQHSLKIQALAPILTIIALCVPGRLFDGSGASLLAPTVTLVILVFVLATLPAFRIADAREECAAAALSYVFMFPTALGFHGMTTELYPTDELVAFCIFAVGGIGSVGLAVIAVTASVEKRCANAEHLKAYMASSYGFGFVALLALMDGNAFFALTLFGVLALGNTFVFAVEWEAVHGRGKSVLRQNLLQIPHLP